MKLLLNILICCVFFTAMGCSPVYYQPNLMNMPNFRKKGEVYLATNLGGNGGDAQAAYAFSDHFMVQGNYMQGVYKDSTKTITLKPKSAITIKGPAQPPLCRTVSLRSQGRSGRTRQPHRPAAICQGGPRLESAPTGTHRRDR